MSVTATKHTARPLHEIAREIRRYWPTITPHAKPYMNAMMSLDSITDQFYADDAQSVVLYFLSNAGTWKGDQARRIKMELKSMLRANGYRI
jgi:hypothetical protein